MDAIILITVAILIIVNYILKYLGRNEDITPKPRPKHSRLNMSEKDFYHMDAVFITWQDKQDYMSSAAWINLREKILLKYNYICADCKTCKNLEVHHITYDRWRHELLEDLVPLCRKCHQVRHDKTGYSYQNTH